MSIILLFLEFVHAWFKSQRNLTIENMALKQQVAMLRRSQRDNTDKNYQTVVKSYFIEYYKKHYK